MVSFSKVVGVLSCGFVLCLGLSYPAKAENAPASSSPKTITGELFRIEDGNYFVKVKDGKEVGFHTDKATQMIGQMKKGDTIEAKVNEQNHALVIRQTQ